MAVPTEKQIRRRLQCKINMRNYRDRRRRSTEVLEVAVRRLEQDIDHLESRKIMLYRSLSLQSDMATAVVGEYIKLLSDFQFGERQIQFLRMNFSPDFTNNGKPLDVFIDGWAKTAKFLAGPKSILGLCVIDNQRIELRVQLDVELTREVIAASFGFLLDNENEATVDALLTSNPVIQLHLTRYFYFDQAQVTHSTMVDDRYAQITALVASLRQRLSLSL
ncbi:hypothetical protein LEN26_016850 [Aphanomyces euteiches]|nr:hypothetical protein LEN26_016850 [Aphanomyces euteiches]